MARIIMFVCLLSLTCVATQTVTSGKDHVHEHRLDHRSTPPHHHIHTIPPPCKMNLDCSAVCRNPIHAKCDLPSGLCHCHDVVTQTVTSGKDHRHEHRLDHSTMPPHHHIHDHSTMPPHHHIHDHSTMPPHHHIHDHSTTPPLCKVNQDCHTSCTDSRHAVCDEPSGLCHCHDHGEISCSSDAMCHMDCKTLVACCHNDHHCHCNEPCGTSYTPPPVAMVTTPTTPTTPSLTSAKP